jgi:hypothetical protein
MPDCVIGRAVIQEDSRRLPTAMALVRSQDMVYGIRGGQSGTGTGFLRVLPFPLPLIHSTRLLYTHHHYPSSIIRGWYNTLNIDQLTKYTQKNSVIWDITQCGPCKNRRFGETYHLHSISSQRALVAGYC